MERLEQLFKNPAGVVKKIAKFCFYACIVLAIFLLISGLIRLMLVAGMGVPFREVMAYTAEDYTNGLFNGYDTYVNGYLGKVQCKEALFVALASLGSVPLYAFGCLVEDVAAIKEKLVRHQEN